MPEYRRFIAYFYEYIDGKKQRNAGFAKVELRSGMWRILFRLTVPVYPDPPIRIYGFVREGGYLLGFPLGSMREGSGNTEEWAYRADAPIGLGKYYLEQLAGLRVQSQDGRCFITVWDDESMDPDRFVLKLPQAESEEKPAGPEEQPVAEAEKAEHLPGPEEQPAVKAESEEKPAGPTDASDAGGKSGRQDTVLDAEKEVLKTHDVRAAGTESQEPCFTQKLLRERQRFCPFRDEEIPECVQIRPCDLFLLQRENRMVGQNSFLQHGYYQYRHLLFGREEDGTCVIGVPGMKNQHEQYMAEMFGYGRFKLSRICPCGRSFGYWLKELNEPEKEDRTAQRG